MLRRKFFLLVVLLVVLVFNFSSVSAAETLSDQDVFEISATIVNEPIEVIPEPIDFGLITDLSSDHTADPVTFEVKGSNLGYEVKLEEEVELTNGEGDSLTVLLAASGTGQISDGSDQFEVEATLQGDETVEGGSYSGSSTITVQYKN